MGKFVLIALSLGVSTALWAEEKGKDAEDTANIELTKRQIADIVFDITSVNPSANTIEITASGPAGRYGNAFCSYLLKNFDQKRGLSIGSGRGFPDEGPMMSGNFVGLWQRRESTIEIKQLVDIDNGDQNLDIIRIDMHTQKVTIRPYILENIKH